MHNVGGREIIRDGPNTIRIEITFGEMRDAGVLDILVYCADYKCSHSIAAPGSRWPDDVRLSDIEPQFVCKACGKRGADVRRTSLRPAWVPASKQPDNEKPSHGGAGLIANIFQAGQLWQ